MGFAYAAFPPMNSISFIITGLLLAMSLAGADDSQIPLRFEFGGGQHSFTDTDPSEFVDGVEMWYQGVHLHGDRMSYILGKSSSGSRTLKSLVLEPGAKGPLSDRVLIDSSKATMTRVGFRGALTPKSIIMTKTEESQGAAAIRYFIELPDLGDFSGDIRTKHGWESYAGRADHAEMIVIGDAAGDKLGNLRFETIYLFGRDEQGDPPNEKPREKASVVRLNKEVGGAQSKALGAQHMDFKLESMVLTLEFDKFGNFERFRYGSDGTMQGVPALDLPVKKHSKPELAPEN
jgi:hypothetical protein